MISILIVEDESVVALDLKKNLERIGYSVSNTVSSGEEVLKKLKLQKPDLIILDIKLRGKLDGIETAGIINKQYGIPFIILSAYSDDRIIERAKSVEPYGYIIKPFGINNLRASIEMAMYRAKMKSEVIKLEAQLRQSEKMKAVGTLAGGIAHDFNNILTVILGYTTLADEKILNRENISADIAGIRTAALRANSLTKHLLAFSRKQILNPEYVEADNIVGNISRMVTRIVPENILLSVIPNAENQLIFIDKAQLEQVVLNLILNAKDAMKNGGSLVLSSHIVCLEKDKVVTTGSIPKGNYITISIKDDGIGISQEDMEHIFDPFFTTKSLHEGTGLGLSTVYGIIKQSSGYIDVASKINEGTKFTIYLEASSKVNVEEIHLQNKSTNNYKGTETIFVVEDEEEIRKLIIKMLNSNGYQTVEASNPGEALLICENKNIFFDLLLTDVFLPLMSGHQLSKRLNGQGKNFKTIYISGYENKMVKNMGVDTGSENFLAKPFQWAELLALVRHTLDG